MPELPEAETIARALDKTLKKRKIVKVEVHAEKLRTPLAPLKTAKLEGCTITGCRRRARYAVADLSDGRAILMHFGMSGVVTVESDEAFARRSESERKHVHVVARLDDGRAIRFRDPRRFGVFEVQRLGADGWPESLAGIGVEPLSEAFTGAFLFAASRGRAKPVKEFIMDNAVVTGIGNIYAAETLFAARVSPVRKARDLTEAECALIVRHAKRILRKAIEAGGSSISDYRRVDGSEGAFQREIRIYARERCPECGTSVAKVTLGGRTSWYCPKCQV